MRKKIEALFLILLFSNNFAFSQMSSYNFKRTVKGDTGMWHKLFIPDELFSKTEKDQSDIRFYGITKTNDTIEAPYLHIIKADRVSGKEIVCKTMNASSNETGYYFTISIPTKETINQLKLEFKQTNFDWKVDLEGSESQIEWYSVLKDARILSINNESTNYTFSTLNFTSCNFHFYRVHIKTKETVQMLSSKVSMNETIEGETREYKIHRLNSIDDKQKKETTIDVDLGVAVSIGMILVKMKDKIDFYRPLQIQYLKDSVKSEKGWVYDYEQLYSGTLSSLDVREFKFDQTVLQKFRLIISNNDNQPLTIDSVKVKGYVHELIARFSKPAQYFLVYGKKQPERPNYDLDENSIPDNVSLLELGQEELIQHDNVVIREPLFKNKLWLWGIMGVIVLMIGGFTLQMIKKK